MIKNYITRVFTYRPVATDCNVDNHVVGRVGEGSPDILVTNISSCQSVVRGAIKKPCNGFGLPVSGRSVNDKTPSMELVIRNGNRLGAAIGLIAWTSVLDTAMDSAVTRHLTVDLLENVQFTAKRPRRAVADSITQKPESRPNTLLLSVDSYTEFALYLQLLAWLRSPGVLALNASGSPFPSVVLPRDKLKSLSTRELDIGVRVAIILYFVVDMDI
jgi:hypothetical protein